MLSTFSKFANTCHGVDYVILCLVLFAIVYCYSTWTFGKWEKLKIPYVRPVPLFGNYLRVALGIDHPVDTYKRIYRELAGHKYGGYFQMRTPYLMIRDPEIVNRILIKDFAYFPNRGIYSDFAVDPLTNNLFFMHNPQWKTIRSKLSPAFTSGKLKLMYDQIKECGQEMMINVHEKVAQNTDGLDVREILAKFSTDVIGTCVFGLKLNAINDSDSEFRRYGKTLFGASRRTLMRELCLMISPTFLKIVRLRNFPSDAVAFFRSVFCETLKYREENNVIRNDFVNTLMQARKDLVLNDRLPKEEKFTELQIVSNAFVMFAAGFETISTTLSFCLYELALKKHIQEKVREEIKSTMAKYNGVIDNDFLTDLNYLDMVIAETLRKYPVTFGLFREAAEMYQVPNDSLIIEKGQKILIPIFSLHSDYRYFNDPELFDPERFLPEEKAKRPNSVYIPFGDGPRVCIGKRFAEMEMKLALVEILSKFSVEPCEKTKIPVTFSSLSIIVIPENEKVILKFVPLSI